MLSFIVWSIDPEIYSFGALSLRYYGILFFLGFLIGYEILVKIFKIEGKNPQLVDTLTVYMLLSTVAGARLGHCLFYEPDYFLQYPIEILYVWRGGLASHGAAVGILFALYLYSRKHPQESYLYILDRMVITIALAAFFIRTGNLMNSEIVGKPTDSSTGVVFAYPAKDNLYRTMAHYEIKRRDTVLVSDVGDVSVKNLGRDTTIDGKTYALINMTITAKSIQDPAEFKQLYIDDGLRALSRKDEEVDHILPTTEFSASTNAKGKAVVEAKVLGIPRHASQVYEALSSLLLFVLLVLIYRRYKADTPKGLLFSVFMIWIFGLRFVYEFLKENQVGFEDSMALNMGQILSIPLVLTGIALIVRLYLRGELKRS